MWLTVENLGNFEITSHLICPLSLFPWRLSTTEFYGLRKSGSTKQIRAKTHHSAELSFCGTIKEVFYAPFTPRVFLINLIPLGLLQKCKFKTVANYPPEENAFWYTYLCWILWPFIVLRCKIRSLESWIYERWFDRKRSVHLSNLRLSPLNGNNS